MLVSFAVGVAVGVAVSALYVMKVSKQLAELKQHVSVEMNTLLSKIKSKV